MGRLFDTWAQADGRAEPSVLAEAPAEFPPAADDEPAADYEPAADAEPADEWPADAPFIEVGDRPTVRAAAVTIQPPPARMAGEAGEHAVFAVHFRPLPAGPGRLAPPVERFGAELVTFHHPEHAVSGQYRGVWQGLVGQGAGGPSRVLLFTGAAGGAGTTTVTLNLALTAATQARLRTAVVDLNGARPALAARLGLPEAPGLADALARRVPLAWALQATGHPGLYALCAGSEPANAAGDGLHRLLTELRKRFDLVLLDGPEASVGGAAGLSALADTTYLVVRQADIDSGALADVMEAVDPGRERLRGCVVTG
jgi:Mrp family chromosome partitioning ATPase